MKNFKQFVDVTEAINYHLANQVPFVENVYRIHSDGFYEFFVEARRMYNEGELEVTNQFDIELLESDIGEFGEYEGEQVALDAPFIVEEEDKKDPPIGKPMRGGSKKFYVYVRKPEIGRAHV